MSRKGKMGFEFDRADVCECEDCEEPELTDVQDGNHESADRVYSPQEMATAFYDLVLKLRAQGAKEVAAFEMAVNFGDTPVAPQSKMPRKKAAK
jgi:hypothetical protein